jgi:hypothetical protein
MALADFILVLARVPSCASLVPLSVRQEVLAQIQSRLRHQHRHGCRCRHVLPRLALLPRSGEQEDGRARDRGS